MSRAYKRMNDITTATAVRGKERETVVSPGVDPLARCNVVCSSMRVVHPKNRISPVL